MAGDRRVLDRGHFGVRLDLHPNLETPEWVAVLPFGEGRVSITGEQHHQDFLAGILGDANRAEVIAVLGEEDRRVMVRLRNTVVGQLTAKMSDRYSPWVRAVQEALLPATCDARVVRGEKKLEVFLKLAMPSEVERRTRIPTCT